MTLTACSPAPSGPRSSTTAKEYCGLSYGKNPTNHELSYWLRVPVCAVPVFAATFTYGRLIALASALVTLCRIPSRTTASASALTDTVENVEGLSAISVGEK